MDYWRRVEALQRGLAEVERLSQVVAVLPRVDRQKYLAGARAGGRCRSLTDHEVVHPYFGDVRFLTGDRIAPAVVFGTDDRWWHHLPYHGLRERDWRELLGCCEPLQGNDPHFSITARFELGELGLTIEEVRTKLCDEISELEPEGRSLRGIFRTANTKQDNHAEIWIAAAVADLSDGESTRSEKMWAVKVDFRSRTGQGLLGVMQAFLHRIRPHYASAATTPWDLRQTLASFLTDCGRSGSEMAYLYSDGWALYHRCPFWLAAPTIGRPQGDHTLVPFRAPETFSREGLEFPADRRILERKVFVQQFPTGRDGETALFFKWAD